ncbi:MAG: hypothetical protein KGH58_01745 [Candidatus Micrarchaeota archaeon]|nr:hypothetical protein [Candidatus Micrarchaeota archaeon]
MATAMNGKKTTSVGMTQNRATVEDIEELRTLAPNILKATLKEGDGKRHFERHTNMSGLSKTGGFVETTAFVGPGVQVEPTALVLNDAKISPKLPPGTLSGNEIVTDGTIYLRGKATISGGVSIYAWDGGKVVVSDCIMASQIRVETGGGEINLHGSGTIEGTDWLSRSTIEAYGSGKISIDLNSGQLVGYYHMCARENGNIDIRKSKILASPLGHSESLMIGNNVYLTNVEIKTGAAGSGLTVLRDINLRG